MRSKGRSPIPPRRLPRSRSASHWSTSKVELGRLELVIKNAIVTDQVERDGLGAVDPDRMKQTIEMVAKTFNLPALAVASVYRPDYLPPRAELQLP
jgi:NitT/TauT family transport system substrate-binding protein